MNDNIDNNVKISASLMCIDWLNAKKEIDILYNENIDLLHVDVIDGRYAPDYTMGTSIINCFRDSFHRPFDYHLMVEEPSRIFDTFDIREGPSFSSFSSIIGSVFGSFVVIILVIYYKYKD